NPGGAAGPDPGGPGARRPRGSGWPRPPGRAQRPRGAGRSPPGGEGRRAPAGAASVPAGEAGISAPQAPVAVRSSWPAGTSASRPKERSSSMVRVLTAVARGSGDKPGLRPTSSAPTPFRARVAAVTRPAGPAPATTTVTRWMGSAGMALLLFLGLAQPLDGQDPGRVDVGAGVGQGLDDGPDPGPPGLGSGVGVVGVGPVPERRGPGGGAGDRLAHWISPPRTGVVVRTMRGRADVALWIRCRSAAAAAGGGQEGRAVKGRAAAQTR